MSLLEQRAYADDNLYALTFLDGVRFATYTTVGWTLGPILRGLLLDMVEATWTDLPSDYTPPIA